MPDPFKRLQTGDGVPLGNAAWNAQIGAARREQARQHDQRVPALTHTLDACLVRVKNDTQEEVGRFGVLGLDGPIWTPDDDPSTDAFLRAVTFKGVVPESGHAGRFCVLVEPLRPQRVGLAFVAGVCQVKIDIGEGNHGFADVVPGETGFLQSADGGTAQILWSEGEDAYEGDAYAYGYEGERWAIIRIGPASGGARIAFTGAGGVPGRVNRTLGVATVTLQHLDRDGVLHNAGTVTAYNLAEERVEGSVYIQMKVVEGLYVVDWEECEAIYGY